ncbi:hypothetical protein KDK95_20265 [Actinospica sp. MGRD01-02]|uniref:LamG-like jellyroll fold domain-containing protein n=1 Tax=Actinospica acidithermotolerans TaxID=2828514 RepID=A0A941EDX2_9ACTN|nr:LamG domain-containing protein [Actinospica acidithermotolerans]MBR7828655.1 hypothetical protein [Actinospica acidithermotolerans]
MNMAPEKRPEGDDQTRFVWDGGEVAQAPAADASAKAMAKPKAKAERESRPKTPKPKAPTPKTPADKGGRLAVSPARVFIATAAVLLLAGGTLGIVEISSQSSGSKAEAAGDPASSGHVSGLASPTAPATLPVSPTASTRSPSPSKSPTVAASSTQAAQEATVAPSPSTSAATTASGPKPLGEWLLGSNALDSAGGHDGVASDVSFSNGAAVLSGSISSYIATSSTVLNTGTGDSFTVSAWVDLTAAPTSASLASTAVSQDANINSAFYLQYFGGTANCWSFTRMDTDTVLSNGSRAESISTPQYNTWTHLVGVYSASTSALYLYVNGTLEGTAKDTTPVASSGPLIIGRARYDKKASDAFTGAIKDVQVFNAALSASEIAAIK